MKVRFGHPGLFNCGDIAVYGELHRLFLRAYRGQHALEIDDPQSVNDSEFMQVACTQMNRAQWEELVVRSSGDPFAPAGSPRRCVVVANGPTPDEPSVEERVAPEVVGSWAEQSLDVLLENHRDAVLLRLAARVSESVQLGPDALDSSSDGRGVTLAEALKKGWIVPRGCGGTGEVQKAVERSLPGQRFFVIIDSDREGPGEEPNAKTRAICKACDDRRIPKHVLHRRELENYVPDRVWQLVLGPIRSHSIRGASAREQRAVPVYRWLLSQIKNAEAVLAGRYSKEALERVRAEIQRKADQKLSVRVMHKLLDEWRALDPPQQRVDDLKDRFSEAVAARAIEKLDEPLHDDKLDPQAVVDLREIARKVEEWL